MDAKKWLAGTVVGGVVLWLLGMLIWQVLLSGFFTANAGGAIDLVREAPIYWAGILGTFAIAALVTTALGWAGSFSLSEGFRVGAIVGFLLWFGVDFLHYASLDRWNLTATIADPILELIRTGIGGAVIAFVLARFSKGEEPSSG
jgi:uncharacterized membrane protein